MCPPASPEQGQRAEILLQDTPGPQTQLGPGSCINRPHFPGGGDFLVRYCSPGCRSFPIPGVVEGSDRPAWVVTAEAVPAVERRAHLYGSWLLRGLAGERERPRDNG